MHQENFGRWGKEKGKTLMREGREGEEEGENKISILAMRHKDFYLCYATWHGETGQHNTLYFG